MRKRLPLLFLSLITTIAAASSVDFRYDAVSGSCKNQEGVVGHNRLDPKDLFEAVQESGRGRVIYLNKNAECVDFSSFNFNAVIGFSYSELINWNFRGANFKNAEFTFASILNADLSGASFEDLILGYSVITGTIDKYSKHKEGCIIEPTTVSCYH